LIQSVDGINGQELYVLNRYINGIDIYNFESLKLSRRIIMEPDGPLSISSISGFYVFNKDSILVFSNKFLDGIFVINGVPKARVSDYIDLEQKAANFHIASGLPIYEYDGKLFIYMLPFKRSPEFSEYHDLDIVLDFKNNSVYRVFTDIKFSEIQKYGMLRFPTRCLNEEDGLLLYSYPFLNDLIIYDINTEKIERRSMSSEKFNKPLANLNVNPNSNAYLLENNYYDAMIFNEKAKMYYRFVRNETDSKDLMGNEKTSYDQPVSIIVADDNLNVIEEINLSPPNKYLVKDFFFNHNGLFISNSNVNNSDIEEDYMSFYKVH
jgi:hypothetical protein